MTLSESQLNLKIQWFTYHKIEMPTWINQVTPWAAGARSCSDTDPYVRKTATMCVAKLYDINPELVEDQAVVIDEDFKILRRYLYKHIERKVIEQFVMWDGIYI